MITCVGVLFFFLFQGAHVDFLFPVINVAEGKTGGLSPEQAHTCRQMCRRDGHISFVLGTRVHIYAATQSALHVSQNRHMKL